MTDRWTVDIVGQAKKRERILPERAIKAFTMLLIQLETLGPYRKEWPNYTEMTKKDYHCHIKKGNPTYVVCWRILDKNKKLMEVYYAGTHEKSPY